MDSKQNFDEIIIIFIIIFASACFFNQFFKILVISDNNILVDIHKNEFEFNKIFSQFPFKLTNEAKESIIPFISQLKELKNRSLINPHTGLPVFLLLLVTISQFDLMMNFFCSLLHIRLNPKYIVLVTLEPQCYKLFKEHNFPIYLLDFSTCEIDYNSITKIKVIIAEIFLKLNYEILYSDIDIEYFGSLEQYLLTPRNHDIAFWFEGRDSEVPPDSKYFYYVNGGFIRFFSTKQMIDFIELMIENNKLYKTKHDQLSLNVMMKAKTRKVACKPIQIEQQGKIINNGYWSCKPKNTDSIIWHIYQEHDLLYACDFILNSPRMKKYQSDVNIPSIFHLTCLSGSKSKMNYLLKSDLLFYDPVSLKCSGENAMKRWKDFFTKNETNLFKTNPRFPLDLFENEHTNSTNSSKYVIIDDVLKMFAS